MPPGMPKGNHPDTASRFVSGWFLCAASADVGETFGGDVQPALCARRSPGRPELSGWAQGRAGPWVWRGRQTDELAWRPGCWLVLLGERLTLADGGVGRRHGNVRTNLAGERRLRGGEARHRDTVGRAAHVVDAQVIEGADGIRVTAMLAADAKGDAGPLGAAELATHADELRDTLVDGLERVPRDDVGLEVGREDLALDIVTGEAESGLREVVRAEAEEVRVASDAVCHDGGTSERRSRPRRR